jgi:ElaB/YqjD/DUF883 family membrane-anchored ribosome-binding protein
MAESLHRSSDVPDFDSYPSTPPKDHIGRTGAEPSAKNVRVFSERPSLEQRAAELGAAAGKIVVMMRETKANLENMAHHSIYDRVTNLAEDAKVRAEHLRQVAGTRAQEWSRVAQEKATEFRRQASVKSSELAEQAKAGYYQARRKADHTVREYPIHVAVAAGVAGFLIGFALKIRRAKRAY